MSFMLCGLLHLWWNVAEVLWRPAGQFPVYLRLVYVSLARRAGAINATTGRLWQALLGEEQRSTL